MLNAGYNLNKVAIAVYLYMTLVISSIVFASSVITASFFLTVVIAPFVDDATNR